MLGHTPRTIKGINRYNITTASCLFKSKNVFPKYVVFKDPKNILLNIQIEYTALKKAPASAKVETTVLCLKDPMNIRSSPTKADVPGKPILAIVKKKKLVE
jgi:hypothetical protein